MSEHKVVGRFAPSPTGRMHAGNIFSALVSWLVVKSQGGEIVLRIEDLDRSRSKQEFADAMMRDFEELGLTWDRGPYYQSSSDGYYAEAFEKIQEANHVYPCFCTRAELNAAFTDAASAPQENEVRVYNGRCRHLSSDELNVLGEKFEREGRSPATRILVPSDEISFDDIFFGAKSYNLEHDCGDFVVRRSDGGFSYNLAVVVDDAREGVNCIIRGCDLIPSTPQQIFLHSLLGLEVPEYGHVPLLCAADGRRLAKRNKDASYECMLKALGTPEAVLGHIAWVGGLQEFDEPATPELLLKDFSIDAARNAFAGREKIIFDENAFQ